MVLSFEIADRLPGLWRRLAAARVPPGIIVCRAVGVHDGSVSERVVAAILAMQPRLPAFIELQQRAERIDGPAEPATIDDLDGRIVVVVGHGSIGRALAARLEPPE